VLSVVLQLLPMVPDSLCKIQGFSRTSHRPSIVNWEMRVLLHRLSFLQIILRIIFHPENDARNRFLLEHYNFKH